MLPMRKVAPATVSAICVAVSPPKPVADGAAVTRPTLRPDLRALDLGATLYVPATRQDLAPLANGDVAVYVSLALTLAFLVGII